MLRGERLRNLRLSKDYTHEELANHLDVSVSQLKRYEMETSEPTAGVIVRMANLFNVSTDYLLDRTDTANIHITENDLSDLEREIINALRGNDPLGAIKAIATHY